LLKKLDHGDGVEAQGFKRLCGT